MMSSATSIPESLVASLQSVLRGVKPNERLAVCLYFQRDLPPRLQTLARIEDDLRRIFPRSAGGRLERPDDYADFQASAIRFVLGEDKRSSKGPRLFESTHRGTWRNTEEGNAVAEALLDLAGLLESIESNAPPSTEGTRQFVAAPADERVVELADFHTSASELIRQAAKNRQVIVLVCEGRQLAEVHPVVTAPPPELAGTLLWEAAGAFEPQPELWEASR